MKFLPIILWSAFAATAVRAADGGLKPLALRTEYLANPDGIEARQPRLQWRVESSERGQKQTAYRVLVASSAEGLARDGGNLWDSGKVLGDATSQIAYAGRPLHSRQQCFWKIQAWDKDGVPSAWSERAQWTMGLLNPEDWQARWISFKDDSPLHTERQKLYLPPARSYRKTFEAPREVQRATLYFSALGIAEMQLNGQKAGDGYFESGWADYAKRAYYRTHDVTALVKQGRNEVTATVAEGWYAGYVGYGMFVGYAPGKAGRNIYGKAPALLAQVEIEYADGTREIVGTEETWQVSSDGPIREADLLMVERYDARKADGRAWHWENAVPAETNGSTTTRFFEAGTDHEIELGFQMPPKLAAYTAPPIRIIEELPARHITEPKPGTYIFDLGENIAGFIRLKVKAPAGTVVQIRYGEMLHPDGRLTTEDLRKARATDFYTSRGDAEAETWQPHFTYHGFQFVELTGLPEKPPLDEVAGLALSSDTPSAGGFACSDPVMTQFWKNTVRTQRANFIEVPTDCPQRDERLGWMGDAQIYVRTASYNADVSAFFTKWLDDLEEAQRDFGAYPDYAPYPFAHGKPGATYGTAWTDAGVICPWTLWQVYGDTRVLARHWASMRKFMEWRRKADPEFKGVNLGNPWGDWLNLSEQTPIEYIDLCYHFMSARLMAEMADALGNVDEVTEYGDRMTALAKNFQRQFIKPGGALAIETQTAAVLAISSGLLDRLQILEQTPWVGPVAQSLSERIKNNGFRMATGETRVNCTKFVFVGAGGGSLTLLQKSGIAEAKGLGGFPIGGQWLVCDKPEIVAKHQAKIYGQALAAAPTMAVPHLDTRILDGKKTLLFGPFATWTTKFLHKKGSFTDLPLSIRPDNLATLINIGIHNLDLVRYLVRYLVQQGTQSMLDRMEVLRVFHPAAEAKDWKLIDAGIRVQAIKRTDGQAGIVHYGTEIVTDAGRTISALLGASPGASVSVNIVLEVIKKCFPHLLAMPECRARMKAMIPTYDEDIKLPANAGLFEDVRRQNDEILQLH